MAIADRNGLPVVLWTGSASPHEVTLVDATLDPRFTDKQPQRIIGDKADAILEKVARARAVLDNAH